MSGKNIYRVLSPENRAPDIGSDSGQSSNSVLVAVPKRYSMIEGIDHVSDHSSVVGLNGTDSVCSTYRTKQAVGLNFVVFFIHLDSELIDVRVIYVSTPLYNPYRRV